MTLQWCGRHLASCKQRYKRRSTVLLSIGELLTIVDCGLFQHILTIVLGKLRGLRAIVLIFLHVSFLLFAYGNFIVFLESLSYKSTLIIKFSSVSIFIFNKMANPLSHHTLNLLIINLGHVFFKYAMWFYWFQFLYYTKLNSFNNFVYIFNFPFNHLVIFKLFTSSNSILYM